MGIYGAVRKGCPEKLALSLCTGTGNRMAVPIFKSVLPVAGAGSFLYGSGFGGIAERRIYGGGAKPEHGYRIPMGTAKELLLHDEAPVYRLLPGGAEKIAPIAAVTTGLWYENYREFAIAPEDWRALDKLIRRETDRLMGNRQQLHKSEEYRPVPER